jgi:hypothetical protein
MIHACIHIGIMPLCRGDFTIATISLRNEAGESKNALDYATFWSNDSELRVARLRYGVYEETSDGLGGSVVRVSTVCVTGTQLCMCMYTARANVITCFAYAYVYLL